jgi:hypothetical protein
MCALAADSEAVERLMLEWLLPDGTIARLPRSAVRDVWMWARRYVTFENSEAGGATRMLRKTVGTMRRDWQRANTPC